MAKVDGGTATAVAIRAAIRRDGQGRPGKEGRWHGKEERRHGDHKPGQPPTSATPTPSPTAAS